MTAAAPLRTHSMREVFHGLRRIVRAGAAWPMRPHDLRVVLPLAQGCKAAPSAVICDSRTLPSTLESGTRAGYDGAKRRRGSYLRRTNTRAHTMDSSSRGIDR